MASSSGMAPGVARLGGRSRRGISHTRSDGSQSMVNFCCLRSCLREGGSQFDSVGAKSPSQRRASGRRG